MSSTYLFMRAGDAMPGRALRFERGRPIAEFSIGRRGTWQTHAAGVSDRHLWVRFDGQCVVLRRDASGPAINVDGRPLPFVAERVSKLPCCIEIGDATLVIDDRAPAHAALDAGALDAGALDAGVLDAGARAPSKPANATQRSFEPVAVSRCVVVPGAAQRVPHARARAGEWVGAEGERMIGDSHATSVMPLEMLRRRGLIPQANAPEPSSVCPTQAPRATPSGALPVEPPLITQPPVPSQPQRRRRPLDARRREGSLVARAWTRSSAWISALELRRWVAAMPRRRLGWALFFVPMVPIFAYALRPEPVGSSAAFETTAWAASHEQRRAAEATAPAPVLPERAVSDGSTPNAEKSAPRDAVPPQRSDGALPASDARSGPTGERLAVDALAAGDKARARALYAELAHRSRDNAAFAEAARILWAAEGGGHEVASGSSRHDEYAAREEERSNDAVTTRPH
ncbi:MAG TPA: hypothetical protein VMG12_34995 [Polyangiaceae bacterium]|nr:hypothetical protein [Polyangiaceae bacterium]